MVLSYHVVIIKN